MSAIIETTTSLVLPAINTPLELRTSQTPASVPGTTIVQVLAAAIGPHSSLIFSGALPFLSFPTPFTPGSSAVCRVLTPPPDAVALKAGDLVLVDCFVRARDDPEGTQILFGLHDGVADTQKILFRDVWRDGLWRSVAAVPLENCHVLDEEKLGKLGLGPKELVYLARTAVAYGGCKAVDLKPGDTVIVGPSSGHYSGAAVEVASALGATVLAMGRNAETLETLAKAIPRVIPITVTGTLETDLAALQTALGTTSRGADAFIEFSPGTVSNPAHIAPAFAALRAGGKVALMGAIPDELRVSYAGIMYRNISLKGQWMYTRAEMQEMIKLAETGLLKIGPGAGHETVACYKLEDWEEALDAAAKAAAWGKQVLFTP
jgi:threonine dehydrogenase-like Zn-dependent dehydrogenase